MTQEQEQTGSLSSLIEFLSRFEETKAHIIVSQREFLLAVRSALDIIIQALTARKPEPDPLAQIFVIGRSMLDYLIAKIPPAQEAISRAAKLEALRSILNMLEREEVELKNAMPSEDIQLRIEAVAAIKKMVEKEIEKASQNQKERVKKVEIE